MIIFEKVRWKNLLSTGNIFTEVDLNVHNSTLIVGENGAGKSTLIEAIFFFVSVNLRVFSKSFMA
jgi:DNA repair exonuclease SbcCD ATPase subunit